MTGWQFPNRAKCRGQSSVFEYADEWLDTPNVFALDPANLPLDGALAIAKFPKVDDERSITHGEVLAIPPAAKAGLNVAAARLEDVAGRSVALITINCPAAALLYNHSYRYNQSIISEGAHHDSTCPQKWSLPLWCRHIHRD